MNVSQSGDLLGQGAYLILAFFRVRISATVSPAEFCTILLSFFCLTLNVRVQARALSASPLNTLLDLSFARIMLMS